MIIHKQQQTDQFFCLSTVNIQHNYWNIQIFIYTVCTTPTQLELCKTLILLNQNKKQHKDDEDDGTHRV